MLGYILIREAIKRNIPCLLFLHSSQFGFVEMLDRLHIMASEGSLMGFVLSGSDHIYSILT